MQIETSGNRNREGRSGFRRPPARLRRRANTAGGFGVALSIGLVAAALLDTPGHGQPVRANGAWVFENEALRVSVVESNATWDVLDKRCGRLWRQAAEAVRVTVSAIRPQDAPDVGVEIRMSYAEGTNAPLPLTARVTLPKTGADVSYEITGDPAIAFGEISLPAPFVLDEPEGVLVIPQNAGLLFRVNELEWDGKTPGGFMSMPWFGATDLASGQGFVGIFTTPDDASHRGRKVRGTGREVIALQPWFQPQKGKLGYTRQLLYHFADRGGYVALAKRYRAHARGQGLVRTLAEKREERPSIDRLVGAVNIYCRNIENIKALKALGIERAVVSGFTKDHVRQINDMGYLSSHYDIYTDLYEPGTPPAKWERCEGFSFPGDVIKTTDGSNQIGWCPYTDPKTGEKHPSFVICWTSGLRVLREKMPRRLADSPFTAYFLDCVTATRLYECWDPDHPLTRTADRETRVRQLEHLTRNLGLVAGSEQGRDWAVPVADYFEGVMSTSAFFANPKAIHAMPFVSIPSEPRYEEYGTNPWRRVPLFQLVYGDCCETTWRWGDNSHRMPALWEQKDLLALLHAAMPTWVLWEPQQELFAKNRDRFKACYDTVCRWRRAVGYAEMVNHERLTKDGLLQRSSFANGASVTVNFANEPRSVAGIELPPRSFLIAGDAAAREGIKVGEPLRVSDEWLPALSGETR